MGIRHVSNNYLLCSRLCGSMLKTLAIHRQSATCNLSFPCLLLASIVLLSPALFADSPLLAKRIRQAYIGARSHYQAAATNATAAWEYGRAAFDLADLTNDDQERKDVAQAGIDACRHAIALQSDSAAAHYYLALNLGELAKTKKLAALRLLHEMEHELIKATQADPAFDYGGPDRSLGMLYLEAPGWPTSVGNRSKAREHLEHAVQIAPDFPDNHITLAEAYAKWGEARNLQRELNSLDQLLVRAKARFTGTAWQASWEDWEARIDKLRKAEERLATNPPISPAERGARRVK